MNAKNAPTLRSIVEAIAAAEIAHAEAPPLLKVATKTKLNAAKAQLREFVYKRKSFNGKCMVRH